MDNVMKQKGFLLLGAVVIIILGSLLAGMAAHLVVTNTRSTINHLKANQALYIADAGLQTATFAILTSGNNLSTECNNITNNVNFTNIAFAEGEFSVTAEASLSHPAAVLASAIDAFATVIPLTDTDYDYADSGQVIINKETISYHGISTDSMTCDGAPRCLLDATRGVGGSFAKAHSAGEVVGQYQCDIVSTGVIPDFVNPVAERQVSRTITGLASGWSSGYPSNSNPTFLHWNSKNWTRYCPDGTGSCPITPFPVPEVRIWDTDILSYSAGWAVGDPIDGSPTFAYWDGSQWQKADPGSARNVQYFGVSCLNANNCWAVGAKDAIAHWNGAMWEDTTVYINDEVKYYDISCPDAVNCWAVGNFREYNPRATTDLAIMLYYDGVAWSDITASLPSQDEKLTAISCNHSNDCWALGDNKTFFHWNGAAWQDALSGGFTIDGGVPESVTFADINCLNANICYAVGNDADTGSPVIVQWDGNFSQWTSMPLDTSVPNSNLHAVTCVNSNDCWAVGDQHDGNALLLHWNGTAWYRYLPLDASVPSVDLLTIGIIGGKQPAYNWRDTGS